MPARVASRARTEYRSPAWWAVRRIRWASCRASTQVNRCRPMLCSVQWCMGAKETTWRSFGLAEGELGVGGGPVAGHYLGDRPVVPAGDQDPFAENFGFQGGAGGLIDGEAEPVLGGGVPGQRRGQDTLDPAVMADGGDLAFHGGFAPAGLAPGQGGGQFSQPGGGHAQGLVEPGLLFGVQGR